MFKLYRAAGAAEYSASALWLVLPPAGNFALGGKVTKTPLKPLRFQPSRLKKNNLFVLFSAHPPGNILPLPRCRSCILFCYFLPLLRGACFGCRNQQTIATQGTPIKRQKSGVYRRGSGRARQTLRHFKTPRAENSVIADHLLLGGFLRGNALDAFFVSFVAQQKIPAGGTNSVAS